MCISLKVLGEFVVVELHVLNGMLSSISITLRGYSYEAQDRINYHLTEKSRANDLIVLV